MKRYGHAVLAAGMIALTVACSGDLNAPKDAIIGRYDVSMRFDTLSRSAMCSDPSNGVYCYTTEAAGDNNVSAVLDINSAEARGSARVLRDVQASVSGTACSSSGSLCYTGTSGYGIDSSWMNLPIPEVTSGGAVTIGLTRPDGPSYDNWPEALKLDGQMAGDSIWGKVEWEPSSYIHSLANFRGTFVAHKR